MTRDYARRRFLKFGASAVGASVVAGCLGGEEPAEHTEDPTDPTDPGAPQEMTTLPVAHVQGTTQAPISVAHWAGIFEDNGLHVNNLGFVAPGDLYRNVQTGNLEFTYGLAPLVAARTYLGGQDVRLISQDVRTFQKLIGPSDVSDPLDLEGELISGYAASSATHYAYHVAFDELYDIDYSDYFDERQLAPPVAVAQLMQGEVAAIWTHPPWTSKLLARDEFHVIAEAADIYNDATGHQLHTADGVANVDLLTQEEDAIRAFYTSVRSAAELIQDDPELSLTASGYTDLFEFESADELEQFTQEVSGLYVEEVDHDQYIDDVGFMFDEAADRGYIEERPDDEIFDLL